MNTERTTIVVKLAGALACVGLAFSGMANAAPAADPGDIPEVDEQFAFEYAAEHETELCTLLDDEWTQKKPSMYLLYRVVTQVADRGGFNEETAGFVLGAAMAGGCPEHAEMFEAITGMELV
jgi:hypothetical protein